MPISCELFVTDLLRSVQFYESLLDFRVIRATDDHVVLGSPFDALSLQAQAALPEDHYFDRHALTSERHGIGVEIVLERSNWLELYERARSVRGLYIEPPQTRPWGVSDFRIADPDGYYLRLSEPRRLAP